MAGPPELDWRVAWCRDHLRRLLPGGSTAEHVLVVTDELAIRALRTPELTAALANRGGDPRAVKGVLLEWSPLCCLLERAGMLP